jgi:UDP-N-acetylmuramate dehydrogenase
VSAVLTSAELGNKKLVRDLKRKIENQTGCRCLEGESLAKHTSWRVGGPARFYVYPPSCNALAEVIQLCKSERLAFFTIGYGTNLLVSDDGFTGCVIDLAEGARSITLNGDELTTGGGAWLGEVVRTVAENGLSGMEKLAGIPGGVGGGMSMNAGAFGMAISDHFISANVVGNDGKMLAMSKEDVGFGYRSAPGFVGKTIFSAKFHLIKARKNQVIRAVEETIADRFRRNVMTLPSAGSVFKNPVGGFSAKMIEAVGGKGLKEGGVEVSKLHANFIINTGGGTAGDVIRLIRRIRSMVHAKFGVYLELEVRTLGFASNILEDN